MANFKLLKNRFVNKTKERWERYKNQIEIAAVTATVSTTTFLLPIHCSPFVRTIGTIGVYGIATLYPAILRTIGLRKNTERKGEIFSWYEFGLGIPTLLVSNEVLSAVSQGGRTNHVSSVVLSYLAARTVGTLGAAALWRIQHQEWYTERGWVSAPLLESFMCGIRGDLSETRQGALNESIEFLGYGRRLDWYLVLSKPLLLGLILLAGLEDRSAFDAFAILSGTVIEAFYVFNVNPRYYSTMENQLPARLTELS